MQHILIIEDDDKIGKLLKYYLNTEGYATSVVTSLNESHDIIKYFMFDLIILDIMLPDGTGFNFINRYKKAYKTPIIILSAMGHVDDRVYGLENGAQDYITKPFEPRELLVRIKNLITRNQAIKIFNFGNFKFNLDSRILFKEEQSVHLTQSERDLLVIFCQNAKSIITRDKLIKTFSTFNTRTIDTMITRLRNKIEIDSKVPRHIVTERNRGYSFWP